MEWGLPGPGHVTCDRAVTRRHESFPLNNCDHYFKLHPAGSAHTRITEQAVERALFSQAVQTEPGPDTLSFGAIRLLLRWDKGSIIRRIRAASHMGGYPAVWKRASGVVIRKPGKHDYTKLKAYRSISLPSCMGIVFGKITAELVAEKAVRRGLWSDRQCTSRKGQSAIDAVAMMVDRVHAAWTNGHITGMLLMDIKAAFPSVTKDRLVNLMKVRQVDRDLI